MLTYSSDSRTARVNKARFRDAMSHFAAAVHLVTTDGPGGRRGVTATSVCSVSDDPATMLVCLNDANSANRIFDQNGVFAVNVLSRESERIAGLFSGQGGHTMEQRFAAGRWTALETGAPILEESIVSFDCRIVESRVIATHRVMIGEVVALADNGPGVSLLYRNRAYHSL